jgi:uncharacterized membrane protein
MAVTDHDTDTRRTASTVVTVRVPGGADGDLATEIERRLARADDVDRAAVTDLRGLRPGLSATIVTAAATVTTDRRAGLADALVEVTGVERAERADRS